MQFSATNQFSEDAHQATENTSGQENREDRERAQGQRAEASCGLSCGKRARSQSFAICIGRKQVLLRNQISQTVLKVLTSRKSVKTKDILPLTRPWKHLLVLNTTELGGFELEFNLQNFRRLNPVQIRTAPSAIFIKICHQVFSEELTYILHGSIYTYATTCIV